jgi:endonuclease/exonuclease/phosphatase family metal-dependent hydrolase
LTWRRSSQTGALVAVVTLLVLLSSCAALPATPPEPGGRSAGAIHVGSFNILRLTSSASSQAQWLERRELLADIIRMEAPQIIGLQEVNTHSHSGQVVSDQLLYLQQSLPEFEFAGHGNPDEVPSENPILYDRDRFELTDQGFFFFSETPDELYSVSWGADTPVYCSWIRIIDRTTGDPLWVYNVHFHYLSNESQRKSAALLAERIAARPMADEPAIVVGDFNTFANSPALRTLLRSGLRHALGPSRTGSYHFSTGVTLWPRIDHILVSDEFEILDGYISYSRGESGFPSDHFPVFATIRIR